MRRWCREERSGDGLPRVLHHSIRHWFAGQLRRVGVARSCCCGMNAMAEALNPNPNHVTKPRLFEFASSTLVLDETEWKHLQGCSKCRSVYADALLLKRRSHRDASANILQVPLRSA